MTFTEKHPLFWPLSIAGGLAVLGMFDLPYGYYLFLRWALTVASVVLAVYSWKLNQKGWLALAIPVFLIWFPPFQVFMDKSAWVVLDLLAGAAFICAGVALRKTGN